MGRFKKIATQQQHQGQVLQITLEAPKGNVLDGEMIAELSQAVGSEARAPEVKALVFQGRGAHFSYGSSVAEHRRESAAEMLAALHGLFRLLIEVGRPALAIVRGCCLGGGLELAAFCHWIFAGEEAKFGQPEINLGVFPPAASLILPYRVGQSAADDLVLSGRTVSAAQARHMGLVFSVSDQPQLEAEEFIKAHLLPKSAIALRFAVGASRFAMHRAFLTDIEALERIYLDELMSTEDANEGIRAFLEKRKAVWSHR